jgi:hypothetical protein
LCAGADDGSYIFNVAIFVIAEEKWGLHLDGMGIWLLELLALEVMESTTESAGSIHLLIVA